MREQTSNRNSTKSIVIRTWSIRQILNQQLVQPGAEAHDYKIYWRECRHNQNRWGNIKWCSTMYTNPQCQWNSQATTFSGNQRYTCTHTKTMYDVCDHSSLPTLAILALGLLKKKNKDDEQFCVGSDNAFLDIWRFASIFWQSWRLLPMRILL